LLMEPIIEPTKEMNIRPTPRRIFIESCHIIDTEFSSTKPTYSNHNLTHNL
jgi:hypothetical protein